MQLFIHCSCHRCLRVLEQSVLMLCSVEALSVFVVLAFVDTCCMGTAESWPEPLIDHLRRAVSQAEEHR